MNYFISDNHNILKVVKDDFACIWSFGDHLKNTTNKIDHLFH